MATTDSSKNMRYGISALSTEHRRYAEPDEIMVQTRDGLMFYKREDGQIVTAVNDYSKKDLAADITTSGIDMSSVSGRYITYHTLDITGRNDMFGDEHVSLGLEGVTFTVPSGKNALCIRVRGNDITNCVAAFVKAARSEDMDKKDLKLILQVDGSEKIVELEFNKLMYVELDEETSHTIQIKNVRYDSIKESYESLAPTKQNELIALNMGNTKFEASTIDIVTFLDDVTNTPIFKDDGRVTLRMLLPVSKASEDNVTIGQNIDGQNYLNVQFLTVK